jgi:hypothetical protein
MGAIYTASELAAIEFASKLVKAKTGQLERQKAERDALAKSAAAEVEAEAERARFGCTQIASRLLRPADAVEQVDNSVLDLSIFNPVGKSQKPRKFNKARALNP